MPTHARITSIRHPNYLANSLDWELWRNIWRGGSDFVNAYLKRMSQRETEGDFRERKALTPPQGFAKTAVTDVKNAVYQRMGDIVRRGGSKVYTKATAGYKGGVDRRGASMNNFIGTQVLPELLFMGQVGVYVDNMPSKGETMADVPHASPYLYTYPVEDIFSISCSLPESESDFDAVLLRDWCIDYEAPSLPGVFLPSSRFERLRLVWIGEDGFVRYQFYDAAGAPIFPNGEPMIQETPTVLELRRIPFVMFDIGDSLLRDVAATQIALMNLASTDINYARKSNFPFYTEQRDMRAIGSHLKTAVMEDGTSSSGGQGAAENQVTAGAIDGRVYANGMDRPGFINPSPDPLRVSIELQRKMEDDIRKQISLAVVSLGSSRASGEARAFDNQGLESGLAFIGMVLENGERKIADHWASYEGNDERDTVVIKYPDRYSLKSTTERLEEADKLTSLMFSIPGRTIKKELSKDAVMALVGDRVDPDVLNTIMTEIDKASYSTSDPKVIELAKEQGLAGDVTLSDALGFDGEKEIKKAEEDHAKRIARIQAAQSSEQEQANPAARGNPDADPNKDSGREERSEATDTTLNDSTKRPVRGEGK